MDIREALEEFNFFNEGDYITRDMSIAKDIVLTAYGELKKERDFYKKKYEDLIEYYKRTRDCDEEFEL